MSCSRTTDREPVGGAPGERRGDVDGDDVDLGGVVAPEPAVGELVAEAHAREEADADPEVVRDLAREVEVRDGEPLLLAGGAVLRPGVGVGPVDLEVRAREEGAGLHDGARDGGHRGGVVVEVARAAALGDGAGGVGAAGGVALEEREAGAEGGCGGGRERECEKVGLLHVVCLPLFWVVFGLFLSDVCATGRDDAKIVSKKQVKFLEQNRPFSGAGHGRGVRV